MKSVLRGIALCLAVVSPSLGEDKLWLELAAAGEGPGGGKHVVLVSGDEEYRSEEALSQLAKILSQHHGFRCTVLFSIDPKTGFVDPHQQGNIPGLETLADADLLVIFTRFRNLPDAQMEQIDKYLQSGRPVLGIRTTTHAFRLPADRRQWLHYDYRYNVDDPKWVHKNTAYSGDKTAWKGGFGGLVMGDTWWYHHGHHNHQSTRGLIAEGAKESPIVRGLRDGDVWGPTDVYAVRLPDGAQPIVMGQTMNRKGAYDAGDVAFGMRATDDEVAGAGKNPTCDYGNNVYNPNDPMIPVAWTKTYQLPDGKQGRVFATTIGAAVDLLTPGTRRLLVNGVYWGVGLEDEIPQAGPKVDLVGDYKATPFRFMPGDHFRKQEKKPVDFGGH